MEYNYIHYEEHKKRVRVFNKRKLLPYRQMVKSFLKNIHSADFKYTNAINPHYLVQQAVKKGQLIKPKVCAICNKEKSLRAHHEDYSKPLEVLWVCNQCHKHIHEIYNEEYDEQQNKSTCQVSA